MVQSLWNHEKKAEEDTENWMCLNVVPRAAQEALSPLEDQHSPPEYSSTVFSLHGESKR